MTIYGVVPTSVIEIADAIENMLEKRHDEGYEAATDLLERECEEQVTEAEEAARLKGFEEGYDEAKEVFDPEGGYEDVKSQAFERGYHEGRDAGWRNGLKAGRESGRKAAELDAQSVLMMRRQGGHGC